MSLTGMSTRASGRSGYSLPRLAAILLDNIFHATTLPLKIVSYFGLVAALGGMVLGAFYLIRYALGAITFPGFATQVLLIIFFGGATLFAIGMVGEYLIRITEEVRRPPRYVVRRETARQATT